MCAEKEAVKTVENVRANRIYTNNIAFHLHSPTDTESTQNRTNTVLFIIKVYHREGESG